MSTSMRATSLAVFSALALGAMGAVASPGCSNGAPTRSPPEAATADELLALDPSDVLGELAYGATSDPVRYANPPRYRGFRFHGGANDAVEVWVRSTDGDAKAWLTRADFSPLASNDDAAPGTKDAHMTSVLPSDGDYYVVFRDAHLDDALFVVSLVAATVGGVSAAPDGGASGGGAQDGAVNDGADAAGDAPNGPTSILTCEAIHQGTEVHRRAYFSDGEWWGCDLPGCDPVAGPGSSHATLSAQDTARLTSAVDHLFGVTLQYRATYSTPWMQPAGCGAAPVLSTAQRTFAGTDKDEGSIHVYQGDASRLVFRKCATFDNVAGGNDFGTDEIDDSAAEMLERDFNCGMRL